jgi:hypothetical protein
MAQSWFRNMRAFKSRALRLHCRIPRVHIFRVACTDRNRSSKTVAHTRSRPRNKTRPLCRRRCTLYTYVYT